MHWKYSPKLVNFMFKQMAQHKQPNQYNRLDLYQSFRQTNWTFNANLPDNLREGMDLDCVHGMALLFPYIQKICVVRIPSKLEALVEFLGLVLKHPNIKHLNVRRGVSLLTTPDGEIMGHDDLLIDGKLQPTVSQSLLNLVSTCGITELQHYANSNPIIHDLLCGLINHMPLLEKLSTDLQLSTPALCQLLQTSQTLTHLCIFDAKGGDLVPVLDSLANNTALTIFIYKERGQRLLIDYRKYLLGILQTNTTLREAQIDDSKHVRRLNRTTDLDVKETIDYYLQLNRFGRNAARSLETKLADFLELLLHAQGDDSRVSVGNLLYGLLRESPSLWIDGCCAATSRKGKRKRQGPSIEASST